MDNYIKVLEDVILDILDARNHWIDIKGLTGLPAERCKEISQIYTSVFVRKEMR